VFDLLYDGKGPFGLSEGFFQNITSELVGLILSVILISLALESYRSWRDNRRWRASRLRIANDIGERHYRTAKEFDRVLGQITEGGYAIGSTFPEKVREQLESITRYYERNVFFLPPTSLVHFENYRAYFKNFSAYLRRLSEASQGERPMKKEYLEEVEKFDFAQLDKMISVFEKSLGLNRKQRNDLTKSINRQIAQIASLEGDELRRALS